MAASGSEIKLVAKEQVVDDTPKVIKGLQFGVLSVAPTTTTAGGGNKI